MADHAVFMHDIYRVRIVPQEGAQHPWDSHSQACQLICWAETLGYGEDFSGEDIEKEQRPADISAITEPESALAWFRTQEKLGRPFVCLGLQADKYGFIMAELYDPVCFRRWDGILVLTEELFKKYVDDKPMTSGEMYNRMKEVASHEFEMLKSYLGGDIYGYIVEVDNTHKRVYEPDLYGELKPFESGIDTLDSLWGFIPIKGNYRKMYEAMIENFPEEVPVEIKTAMLEGE